MAKIGVHDSDAHIIEFLCETIKQQLIQDHFQTRASVSHMPERPLATHNDLCCQMMKCWQAMSLYEVQYSIFIL